MTKTPPFSKYKVFYFEDYHFDAESGVLSLAYSLDREVNFEEKYFFPTEGIAKSHLETQQFKNALESLFIMAGISYFKAYLPEKMDLGNIKLNQFQAIFWNRIYQRGLGEFFYRNDLDFRGLINFPFVDSQAIIIQSLPLSDRSLLPIGGGKDSLVSAEIMNDAGHQFDFFSLRDAEPIRETAKILGKKRLIVGRELSSELLRLNKMGAYNGHVPITAQISFLLVVCSILYDYKNIVMSLEKSADFGQMMFLDEDINHQYSKSYEFEIDFLSYIQNYVCKDVVYFSLLRGWYEIKIAEIFSQNKNIKKYLPLFTSCNGNFKIVQTENPPKWCCSCPKCAFVFCILTPFFSKDELLGVFGKNLFADENLVDTFRELIGIKDFKPFECVGTPEETIVALYLAWESGKYAGDTIIKMFEKEMLPEIKTIDKMEEEVMKWHKFSTIPKKFVEMFKQYL